MNIGIVILTSNIIDALFLFNSAPLEFVVKSVLVTFLLLLFGEILPKVLSQSNPHSFARYVVYPIKVFRWICYPLSYVLVRTGGRLSRMATRPEDISMEQLADAVDLAKGAYEGIRYYFRWFDPAHEREEEFFTKLGMPVTLSQAKIQLTAEQAQACAEKSLPWGPTDISGYETFTVESCLKLLEMMA